MDDRRFSDEEVREILARAVEARSASPSRALTRTEGISLSELQTIGEEAGIDPARIEEAARGLTKRRREGAGGFFGGPTNVEFERTVEGSIQDIPSSELRAVIRRTMGEQGEFDEKESEGWLEWSSTTETGFRFVSLTERNGRVSISAAANLSNTAAAMFIPAGIVGMIFSILAFIVAGKENVPALMVAGTGLLPTLYLVMRSVFARLSSRQVDRLEQVVADLARLAQEND